MKQQTFFIFSALIFCVLIQCVLGNIQKNVDYRSDQQPLFRSINPLYFGEEEIDPRIVDIKNPLIKRFKPCYYSPIQCLIKK